MQFNDAKGRKVVDISTAETVGKVEELLVDPARSTVVALRLKKTPDSGDIVLWDDIEGFGEDAVTLQSADRIGDGNDATKALMDRDRELIGKRALSTGGDALGTVDDAAFDPETGAVTAIAVGEHDVHGGQLVGIGSYAVVVDTTD